MNDYPPSLDFETLNAFLVQNPISIVHFDAVWDGMGFQLQRRIREIAKKRSDSTGFGFIDIDAHNKEALAVGVLNVPACAYYRGLDHVTTIIGLNQDIEANLDIVSSGGTPDGSAQIKIP